MALRSSQSSRPPKPFSADATFKIKVGLAKLDGYYLLDVAFLFVLVVADRGGRARGTKRSSEWRSVFHLLVVNEHFRQSSYPEQPCSTPSKRHPTGSSPRHRGSSSSARRHRSSLKQRNFQRR